MVGRLGRVCIGLASHYVKPRDVAVGGRGLCLGVGHNSRLTNKI